MRRPATPLEGCLSDNRRARSQHRRQLGGQVTKICDTCDMELAPGVVVEDEALRAFCEGHGVRRLGLFGSALRGELTPTSDIDLLVEFEPDQIPGLLGMAQLELELSELLGREVDLRTQGDLSRYFRDEVAASARIVYDAA